MNAKHSHRSENCAIDEMKSWRSSDSKPTMKMAGGQPSFLKSTPSCSPHPRSPRDSDANPYPRDQDVSEKMKGAAVTLKQLKARKRHTETENTPPTRIKLEPGLAKRVDRSALHLKMHAHQLIMDQAPDAVKIKTEPEMDWSHQPEYDHEYPNQPSFYRQPRFRSDGFAGPSPKKPKLPKILLTEDFQKKLKKKKRGRPRKYARLEDLAHPERLDILASSPGDEPIHTFLAQTAIPEPFLARRDEFDAVSALMDMKKGFRRDRSLSRSPQFQPYNPPTLESISPMALNGDERKFPYMAVVDRKRKTVDPEWRPRHRYRKH